MCIWPAGAVQVSARLALVRDAQRLVAYSGGDPIFTCAADDRTGLRLMAAQLSHLRLAGVGALASALGVSGEFVRRNRNQFEAGGVAAFTRRRPRRRGAYKLVGQTKARAQRCLNAGWSEARTAAAVGLSPSTIHLALVEGRLHRPAAAVPVTSPPGPSVRAVQDQACAAGVAVKRTEERTLAPTGQLTEASVQVEAASAVAGAGVLLALPALLEQGLLSVSQRVLAPLAAGFYGLRSLLLTLTFMALLRLRTVEQLRGWAPGELGLLLGLDRAPEVKTVRRKLAELGRQGRAHAWQQALTAHWVQQTPDTLGHLYVDGHVRAYHGRAHRLPAQRVARLGRLMPGTQDIHVHDAAAQPLFYVTAEANTSLLRMLDDVVLPEIRDQVGPERRVLVVFDREGWSPASFARWQAQGFDVLTYRKGKQTAWPEDEFVEYQSRIEGRPVHYHLAERCVRLTAKLEGREIRRLTPTGHQTAIVTTCTQAGAMELAHRMFGRWRQENYFRYMRQEYALDQLCTHAVEPADPDRWVSHPERAQLDKQCRAAAVRRDRLYARLGDLTEPHGHVRYQGRSWSEAEILTELNRTEAELRQLEQQRDALPRQVPLHQLLPDEQIVKLEEERKRLTDLIKMIAYRAESALARQIEPYFARHEDEARRFLSHVFQATADLLPDEQAQTLTVRFHGLGTPRETRALQALCQTVTETDTCYPGTPLKLRFEVQQGHIP